MGPRRRHVIRQHALALLTQFSVEHPPVPVEDIALGLGVRIVQQHYPDDETSGFYLRHGVERVIGVNRRHSLARRRFTIAHELGHVLLTAHDDLHIDRSIMLRDPRSARGTDWREVEANAFASELLMPIEMLSDELAQNGGLNIDNRDSVVRFASRFGVSTQALLIRLSSNAFILSTGDPQ